MAPVRRVEEPSSSEQRLAALFEAHGRAVYAFARRRGTAADAEEVVSETFLVAWRRLDDVPDDALPWLLGTARRCLANVTRSQARQSALRLRLTTTYDDEQPAAPAAVSRSVSEALARLTPADRDAITLLAWEGLTPAEAAVALGCTRAAVYLRLHRARRRLAAELTDPRGTR